MPFAFKIARRLARIRLAGAMAATLVLACSGEDPVSPLSLSSTSTVATVEVAPRDLTDRVGGLSHFTAILRDAQGKIVTGRPVQWKSNDTLISRMSPTGLGAAVGVGTAVITATADGHIGTARATIQALPPGTSAPSTVTDLVVAGSTDSSLSIQFTEVNDGTGVPSSYLFRYAREPLNWGTSTAAVIRGTCAPVLTGSSVGSRFSCVVSGLTGGGAYDFQLRAFRVSAGSDTVFGGLSNVAKGVTGSAAILSAAVAVTPGNTSLAAGESVQYSAVVMDAAGREIAGKSVSWASSNPAVAAVSPAGLATANAAGTATITATADGQSASSTLTVTAAGTGLGSTTWPHEPAGFTELVDQPFDGLNTLSFTTSNPRGLLTVGNDPGAPHSPSGVLEFRYPSGYTGGGAPGTSYYGHWAQTEVYAGFYWKPSSPWQNHPSNVNKIAFWQTETWGSSLDLQMYGPAPYKLHVVTQFPSGTVRLAPNVTTTPVQLGVWHRVEWHIKYATTPGGRDGIVEWWLDGTLQGRYTNVQTPADRGFIEYQLSPTWGGIDGVKNENDYFHYDHLKISRR